MPARNTASSGAPCSPLGDPDVHERLASLVAGALADAIRAVTSADERRKLDIRWRNHRM